MWLLLVALGIRTRASHKLDKHSTSELYSLPPSMEIWLTVASGIWREIGKGFSEKYFPLWLETCGGRSPHFILVFDPTTWSSESWSCGPQLVFARRSAWYHWTTDLIISGVSCFLRQLQVFTILTSLDRIFSYLESQVSKETIFLIVSQFKKERKWNNLLQKHLQWAWLKTFKRHK